MGRRSYKPSVWIGVCVGVLIGLFIGSWSRHLLAPCVKYSDDPPSEPVIQNAVVDIQENGNEPYKPTPKVQFLNPVLLDKHTLNVKPKRNIVLIGVMTAKKYLNSRIIAGYETWATTIPGKVIFFSSEGSEELSQASVPVIGLKGVDDSYPPQKKSFLMIKYMHDHFIDQYDWFMRADDDVYIKGDKLGDFLQSINSSEPRFIGQAGLGNKDEFGLLSLNRNENFCMGGPSMVFSRPVLKKMAPHISYCLKNLYTTHEDVEIGRCVQKFAGVSCTWAFEFQHLFYHNHKEPNGSFTHSLNTRDIHRAITLHPLKNHTYHYRVHDFFYNRHALDLRHKLLLLERQVYAMNSDLQDRDAFYSPNKLGLEPSLTKFTPKSREEVLTWEYIGKSIYSHKTTNPKPGITPTLGEAFDDIMMQVMSMINKNARQRGRTIDFKEILYGYKRVDPVHSADYILDLLLIYRKHKGRKMTIPVRRHAYLQQTFGALEFIESEDEIDDFLTVEDDDGKVKNELIGPTKPQVVENSDAGNSPGLLNIFQQKMGALGLLKNDDTPITTPTVPTSTVKPKPIVSKMLHFIVPLVGRFDTFKKFMESFEIAALQQDDQIVLMFMLYQSDSYASTDSYIEDLKSKYSRHKIEVVPMEGEFSRGQSLQKGASQLADDSLLIFMDIDIYISPDSITLFKSNTIINQQVYYPIVFSQFDPVNWCLNSTNCANTKSNMSYLNDYGYWRQFGFGIASMYKKDFIRVGGFDTSIVGWGKEDVDLFERYIKYNVTIFRAVDPGLVHIFHSISCDPNLEPAQYQMCLGSKASTFGSVSRLAQFVYSREEILHKNELPQESEAT